MIASLPMYDWEEVRPSTDRLWRLIRDRLRAGGMAAPEALDRSGSYHSSWLQPDLALSQTCGFPYRTELAGKVALVGTPDFGVEGASPGHYASVLVVGRDRPGEVGDFLDGVLALNGFDSQSGWAAPQTHATGLGRPFGRFLVTGAHLKSAQAVAAGRADIAGIDVVTLRFLRRLRPGLAAGLRVVATTAFTPGLPLITAAGNDAAAVTSAVRSAIADLPEEDRANLGIRGLADIPHEAYMGVPTPPRPAQ
jgi:ABC-type phosphate/phosphonate transport system substrate-binding protein